MSSKSNYWVSDLFFLALFLSIFFFLWLGGHALMVPDEARYSEIAREMVATGNYITPHLNGVVFLDKPILYYWLQSLSIKIFGLHEWSLRFFPALFGVFGCLITYSAGRLLFERRTGILAAIILATSPLYFLMAHYANLDLEMAVLISASLFAFILAIKNFCTRQKLVRVISRSEATWGSLNIFLVSAYIFMGLAVLTKGLIGILFPLLILGSGIILTKRWRFLLEMHLLWGLLIVLAITLPWFIAVQKANPEFLHYFFWQQQFSRFVSQNFNDQEQFWFYVPVILVGVFPWVSFLPGAIVRGIKQRRHPELYRLEISGSSAKAEDGVIFYLLLWSFWIFIFFTIPISKTIGYILPILPPLVLLVAHYLNQYWEKEKFRKLFLVMAVLMGLADLIFIYVTPYLDFPSTKPLALTINRYIKPGDEIATYYIYYQDLPVYTKQRITIVSPYWNDPDVREGDNWRHQLSNGMRSPEVRQWLIDDKIFWQRWKSNKRLFVLVDAKYLPAFQKLAGKNFYKLSEYQDVMLVTNKINHQTQFSP